MTQAAATLAAPASQQADSGAHIWWGPIVAEKQAGEIIAWTAWSLILIGLAPAAALALVAFHGELRLAAPYYQNLGDNWFVIGEAIFLTIELSAAVLLLRKRYWIAALVLFFCCVFVIAAVLATMVRLTGDGVSFDGLSQNLLLIVCLLFFTRLVWRALEATAALRKLRMLEHFS
jgi:hypothetical protein